MIFENPWAFSFIIIPFLAYILFAPVQLKRRAIYAPFLSIIKDLSDFSSNDNGASRKSFIEKLLFIFVYLSLVCALAKPVLKGQEVTDSISVREFFLVLDLSESMRAKDSQTGASRLQIAKTVVKKFVEKRKKDRIGLIVFADSAYVQSGLTNDYDSLIRSIDELEVGMAGMSTNIGDALGLGVKTISKSSVKDKVIILFTDGSDTGSRIPVPIATKLAVREGVKVYPIGFGNPKNTGENPIDFSVLQLIADKTGGSLFKALNSKELQKSYETINKIEPSEVKVTKFIPFIDIYYYFLIPLLFYFIFKVATLCFDFKPKGRV